MKSLPSKLLYKSCKEEDLPFTSTKNLSPLNEIVGQARAQEAVRFALAMPDAGYNVYAVGRNGLGKRSMILRYLKTKSTAKRELFARYQAVFAQVTGVKLIAEPDQCQSNYWLQTLILNKDSLYKTALSSSMAMTTPSLRGVLHSSSNCLASC